MDELKPCPFCGGEADVKIVTRHIKNNLIVIKCDLCGASTKTFSDKKPEKACMAWNRRVSNV